MEILKRSVSSSLGLYVRRCPLACTTQQRRHEHIFRRMHPPKLGPEGEQRRVEPEAVPDLTGKKISWVHEAEMDREHYTNKGDEFVYIHEGNTDDLPVGELTVILCWHVEGLGRPGDVVQVDKDLARHKLIPLGAALYNSEENLSKMKGVVAAELERRKREGDTTVPDNYDKLIKMLQAINLPVPMNPDHEWTLNTSHLRIALRLQGIWLPESAISLPEEVIDSPREFSFTVTLMNNGGNVHTQIDVLSRIVDSDSAEARQQPFARVFEYKQKTLSEAVLEKYYELYPDRISSGKAQTQANSHL